MRQVVNLTVATDINGMGGISSVLNVYQSCGFFEKNNVKLISTHNGKKKVSSFQCLLLYLFAVLKIVFYLSFYKVGLIHIHMASRGSYMRKSLIVRLVKLFKGKVILHLHGAEFRDFYSKECSPRKQRHIQKTFELADSVVVLSSQWVEWAKGTFGKNNHIHVIYNAVPELKLNREDVQAGLVTFFGRIGQRKGVLDLIRCFPKVLESCPSAELHLAGDGDIKLYEKEIEELGLRQSVRFLGWIAGKEKASLLSRADIYCLPSYNEGFPMGVLEAMSAGVPVVASKAGGIPDAIKDYKEGLLIDAGDTDALANALVTLIKNRELNKLYSASAHTKFDQCFSINAIIPQVNSLYSKVLKAT